MLRGAVPLFLMIVAPSRTRLVRRQPQDLAVAMRQDVRGDGGGCVPCRMRCCKKRQRPCNRAGSPLLYLLGEQGIGTRRNDAQDASNDHAIEQLSIALASGANK
jgi:hypothetical protein